MFASRKDVGSLDQLFLLKIAVLKGPRLVPEWEVRCFDMDISLLAHPYL